MPTASCGRLYLAEPCATRSEHLNVSPDCVCRRVARPLSVALAGLEWRNQNATLAPQAEPRRTGCKGASSCASSWTRKEIRAMPQPEDWKVPTSVQPKPEDYTYDLEQALASVVAVHSIIPADA